MIPGLPHMPAPGLINGKDEYQPPDIPPGLVPILQVDPRDGLEPLLLLAAELLEDARIDCTLVVDVIPDPREVVIHFRNFHGEPRTAWFTPDEGLSIAILVKQGFKS